MRLIPLTKFLAAFLSCVAQLFAQVPTGTLMINGGNTQTNETKITLSITGENCSKMMISSDKNFSSSSWEAFKAGSRNFQISSGDGRKQVYLKLMDDKGNQSSLIEAEIVLDQTPPTGSLTIEPDADRNQATIKLSAEGASQYRLSNREDFKGAEWKNYRSLVTGWVLSSGDGEKTVFGQFKDAAGNISQIVSAKTKIERAEPTQVSVLINNGQYYTQKREVTLSISAQDAKEIKLGESWQPYTTTLPYTLPEGDGDKMVEIWVRSASGKETKAKAKIVLDATPPQQTSISILQNTDAPLTSRKIDLKINAFEAEEMMISSDANFSGARWIPYRQNYYGWDLGADGDKVVYAKFKDAAGNESQAVSVKASLDRSAPEEARIEIKAKDMGIIEATNQKITNHMNEPVTLLISGQDAVEMLISNSPNFKDASWQPFKNKLEDWNLNAKADGDHFVYLKLRDQAGNQTRPVADNIKIDTQAPFANKISIAKNNGFCTDKDRNVLLNLSSSGADYMFIYNDGDESSSDWEPYSPSKLWRLGAEQGPKIVSVKFKDFVGNESAPVSTGIVLDNLGPTSPQIKINNGDQITNNPDKKVLVSVAANDADQFQISSSSEFSAAKWQSMSAANFMHELEGEDGKKTLFVRFKDQAGNLSEVASSSIILDRKPPIAASIKINEGQKITNSSKKVKLSLFAEGAAEMMVSNRYDFADANWEPFKKELDWTLKSGQGDKIVYARFKTAAQNTSGIVYAQIWVDEEAPKDGKIVINENERFCTEPSKRVTLKVLVKEASQMLISCNADFSGASWQSYQRIVTGFELCGEDGLKTVYAKFKDEAGNETEPVSASIILDRGLPEIEEIILDRGAAYTNHNQGIIQIDLKVNGATEMMISNNDKFMSPAVWEPFTFTKNWTLGKGNFGRKEVYFKFRDEAGNTTLPVSKGIIHDAQPPVIRNFSINQGKSTTTESSVALTIDALGASEMMISTNPNFDGASWQPFTRLLRHELDSQHGLKTIYIKLKDAAQNETMPKSASITFLEVE
jgi:hypothetical protein